MYSLLSLSCTLLVLLLQLVEYFTTFDSNLSPKLLICIIFLFWCFLCNLSFEVTTKLKSPWIDIHNDHGLYFVHDAVLLLYVWWNGDRCIWKIRWERLSMRLVYISQWRAEITIDLYVIYTTVNRFTRLWKYQMYSGCFQNGKFNFDNDKLLKYKWVQMVGWTFFSIPFQTFKCGFSYFMMVWKIAG